MHLRHDSVLAPLSFVVSNEDALIKILINSLSLKDVKLTCGDLV